MTNQNYRWTDTQRTILDISVNMFRISKWVKETSEAKQALIKKFMDQTEELLSQLSNQNISEEFRSTLRRFTAEFNELKKEVAIEKDKRDGAKRALKWADILQDLVLSAQNPAGTQIQ